jgi:hypothetical protein
LERGISVNQLVSSTLKKHSEWDRFPDKVGYVGNPLIPSKQLVALMPNDKLEEIETRQAKLRKETLLILYKTANVESFLQ